MNIFRKAYEKVRDKVFGVARQATLGSPPNRVSSRRRLDQGPATKAYVKAQFPKGIFTKAMTVGKRQTIRDIMLYLRPEQREIAVRFGYNKGVQV